MHHDRNVATVPRIPAIPDTTTMATSYHFHPQIAALAQTGMMMMVMEARPDPSKDMRSSKDGKTSAASTLATAKLTRITGRRMYLSFSRRL